MRVTAAATARQNRTRPENRVAPAEANNDDWAMTRRVRLEEVLLGVEGGALLRPVVDGDDDFVAERVAAIRRLAGRLDGDRSQRGPAADHRPDYG